MGAGLAHDGAAGIAAHRTHGARLANHVTAMGAGQLTSALGKAAHVAEADFAACAAGLRLRTTADAHQVLGA